MNNEERVIRKLRMKKLVKFLCIVKEDEYGAYTYRELLKQAVGVIKTELMRIDE